MSYPVNYDFSANGLIGPWSLKEVLSFSSHPERKETILTVSYTSYCSLFGLVADQCGKGIPSVGLRECQKGEKKDCQSKILHRKRLNIERKLLKLLLNPSFKFYHDFSNIGIRLHQLVSLNERVYTAPVARKGLVDDGSENSFVKARKSSLPEILNKRGFVFVSSSLESSRNQTYTLADESCEVEICLCA